MAARTTAKERARILSQLARSGMKVSAFAAKRGMNPSTLSSWLYAARMEKKGAEITTQLSGFAEVVPAQGIEAPLVDAPRAWLHLTGGTAVEFTELPPPDYLAAFVRAVGAC